MDCSIHTKNLKTLGGKKGNGLILRDIETKSMLIRTE